MRDINEVYWNPEHAARVVEQLLLVPRGQGTRNRTSVLGINYITHTQDGIKKEGALVSNWGATAFEAWSMYLHNLAEEYFNIMPNSKIYWRLMPQLEKSMGTDGKTPISPTKWLIYSRFVVGRET